MTNPAQIMATALVDGLQHPGIDNGQPFALPLPMFKAAASLPTEQAKAFADQAGLPDPDIAKLTSEALLNALAQNGVTTITVTELQALRDAVAATDPQAKHQVVQFWCACGAKTFRGNITDYGTEAPKHSPQLIKAMQAMSAECALGHQAVGA